MAFIEIIFNTQKFCFILINHTYLHAVTMYNTKNHETWNMHFAIQRKNINNKRNENLFHVVCVW